MFVEILGRQNFLIKLEQTCKLPPRPRDQMILSLLLVHMKMNFCKSVSLKMCCCPNLLTRYRFEECGPADRLNLVGMMMPCLLSTCRRATGSATLRVNLALARQSRATKQIEAKKVAAKESRSNDDSSMQRGTFAEEGFNCIIALTQISKG